MFARAVARDPLPETRKTLKKYGLGTIGRVYIVKYSYIRQYIVYRWPFLIQMRYRTSVKYSEGLGRNFCT